MKIFELQWNEQGEKEWIAANTVIEALLTYLSIASIDMMDFNNEDDIVEVPKYKWAKMRLRNNDYDPEDPDDWESMTFKQWMKNVTKPDIIAGTMYE